VKGNPTCRPKVLETLRFFKDVQMMTKKGREFLTPEFARPRIPLDILFAIGGDEGNHMDFIEAYDARADRWTKVSSTQTN
jgi:kelch-like protein 10